MAMLLHYGELTITLDDAVEVDSLLAEIASKTREGGGLVDVTGGKRSVRLVVSPGQYVWVTDNAAGGSGKVIVL